MLRTSAEVARFFAGVENRGKKVLLITEEKIEKIYKNFLNELPFKIFTIPTGEGSKSREMKALIEDFLFSDGYLTHTELIAFGGGVVSDLTGFIASTYMRGVTFSIIPTTVTAFVDASVGGKNGINTAAGKNVLGTFYTPQDVCLEEGFLATLPQNLFLEQFSEVVKITLTSDCELFFSVSKPLPSIRKLKETIVALDKVEPGIREVLNFGHTFAHAYEKVLNYTISHGHAVWIGMYFEALLSVELGHLPEKDWEKIRLFFTAQKIDFTVCDQIEGEKLYEAMLIDKKNKGNEPYFVLLEGIGRVYSPNNTFSHPVKKSIILRNLHKMRKEQLCDVG
jgi:3-dehydroquinate synthase